MYESVPVILLKNLIILPNQEIKIELNNLISSKTVSMAISSNKGEILVVTPVDELEEEPRVIDLPNVGVIAKIKNKIDNNGITQVKLSGIKRVAIDKYYEIDDILYSNVMYIDLPKLVESEQNATRRELITVLKEYIDNNSGVSNDILEYINKTDDLNKITDAITSFIPFSFNKRLEYMQEINALKRAKSLINDILEEIKIIELDNEIDSNVNKSLEHDQKEFYLKEKLKAIKEELEDESWKDKDVEEYKKILKSLKIDKDIKSHIEHEIEKYSLMSESSHEVSVERSYLDTILNLPWNKATKDVSNFNEVKKNLDSTHFGLETIKTRITEYVAIKNINKNIESPIICLVGPPGVGKTSIAMSIADALNRKFVKISVGGLNDSTELIGTRRTYLASSPGKIIQGIKKCGVNNPVILIDEVDKMVKDYKGDPASVLLEILDPTQNELFTDNYIEEPFSLKNVLFILTANDVENIPATLLDRVELIYLNSYTIFEKKDIAKNYILPKVLTDNMVYDKKIKFSDELLYFIIDNYTHEAGVRDLERVLSTLARRITLNNVKILNEERVVKLLGEGEYLNKNAQEKGIGVVNMLAVSNIGGITSVVEVVSYKGEGKVTITGNVGNSLNESVSVCISFLKNKYKYNLSNLDLHIHFVDTETKKDGASAGLSITVAIASLMEKREVPDDIAFTGEITLNGSILKIGGLKEKLISAYNNNIKTVYIPDANINDLKCIPDEIKANIDIIPVNNFEQIYTKLFK